MTGDFAYRGTAVNAEVSGTNHALSPGTTLQAQLHSNPVNLGNFKTDTTGSITAQLTIPGDVPAGYHTLHFYGTDISGQPIDIFKTIYIAATADDKDGNGVLDSTQKCVGFDPAGIDSDHDGIDDACDNAITLPPAPVQVTALFSSATQNLEISTKPATSAQSEEASPTVASSNSPKVLAARTSGPAAVAKKDLKIPARYYIAVGFGFLAATSLSYLFKRGQA
jgi:hypothetical protein